jgi:2-isopropylmalate synthase
MNIQIFDTSLRDGEQSPGVTFNNTEKLDIARQLAKLNVDVIEAGFPIASEGDFQAVETIAQQIHGPVICGLARANKNDIQTAAKALKHSERPRIHTFISSSDIHIKHQLRSTRKDVLGLTKASVAYAKQFDMEIEFSPMDATRSDPDFVIELCQLAVDQGASVINLPDTVGYAVPKEYYRFVSTIKKGLNNVDDVIFSVHCHDDLGLAVANSLSGVDAGAQQIECSVNGIGERAGNCSLEEVVMAINTRSQALNSAQTNINLKEIARSSRLISRYTGYPVAPNKAIVGLNAFSHESGIHQDGVLKHRDTYEIMNPVDIGVETDQIVLGKHSGRHALQEQLKSMGYPLEGAQLNKVFKQFKQVADGKQNITLNDLEALVSDQVINQENDYSLDWYEVNDSSSGQPEAEVLINNCGEKSYGQASGDGAMDALFDAISQAMNIQCQLIRYSVNSVTEGKDALAEVVVVIEGENSNRITGQAINPDTIRASGQAYVRALSSLKSQLNQ